VTGTARPGEIDALTGTAGLFTEGVTMGKVFPDPLEIYLTETAGDFHLSAADARKMVAGFHEEMRRGLAGEPASLRMLPTFARRPRGTEKGNFLALDLGGTNVRVMDVYLDGKGRAEITAVSRFTVPREIMTGTGDGLFDFLADCVGSFCRESHLDHRRRHQLAFTFSFPVEQLSIASGKLIVWTKGFAAAGVEGKDVVALLAAALQRRKIAFVQVAALANDTVGTMVATSYADPDCDMGVILGTGTNACYPERAARIVKCPDLDPHGEMIVNLEWGNFNRLRTNRFDGILDRASRNEGRQQLEKMISGMYLGELVRLVIQEMMGRRLLFREAGRVNFAKRYALTSAHMAGTARGGDFLAAFGLAESMPEEKRIVAEICRLVAVRAARLAGTAIAAVVTWMDPALEAEHTIAIDGSLFKEYPGFRQWMREILTTLLGEGAGRIKFTPARDGSGIGAAIIGAVAASSAPEGRRQGSPNG